MRLLIVSQYYWPEPFRITEIAEALVQRGHSVDVLTSVPNIPSGEFYDGYGWFKKGPQSHNGVNIDRVNVIKRGNNSPIRLVLNCASFAFNSMFHYPKYKKGEYDAIFVFNNSPVTKIYPAKRLAKKLRVPNIIWILDIWPESMYLLLGWPQEAKDTFVRKTARNVSRWLYKSADLLLTSSEDFEPKLRKLGLRQPIAFYPNFAERPKPTDKTVKREDFGFGKQDFVIGFSGNVGVAQGLEKLVEAAALLNNDSVKWLIVGDGPEREHLETAAKQAGQAGNFVFTGWVDSGEVASYLSVCDALLVSLKDNEVLNYTVPAKTQTYMYAGKPIVAFMNGAGAKLVADVGCGVGAKAEDARALATAVETLHQTAPAKLQEMGVAGREYCARHFDKDLLIDRLVEHIEGAVENYKQQKR